MKSSDLVFIQVLVLIWYYPLDIFEISWFCLNQSFNFQLMSPYGHFWSLIIFDYLLIPWFGIFVLLFILLFLFICVFMLIASPNLGFLVTGVLILNWQFYTKQVNWWTENVFFFPLNLGELILLSTW